MISGYIPIYPKVEPFLRATIKKSYDSRFSNRHLTDFDRSASAVANQTRNKAIILPDQHKDMKQTKRLLALGLLLGTCVWAPAQDKPEPQAKPKKAPSAATIKKFDKDGDGTLSDSEQTAMALEKKAIAAKRREETLKKLDSNSDGKITDDEKKAAQAADEAKCKEVLEKYDGNKDGKLDTKEAKTARDAGEKLPSPKPAKSSAKTATAPKAD
jgi:hypothetical protein